MRIPQRRQQVVTQRPPQALRLHVVDAADELPHLQPQADVRGDALWMGGEELPVGLAGFGTQGDELHGRRLVDAFDRALVHLRTRCTEAGDGGVHPLANDVFDVLEEEAGRPHQMRPLDLLRTRAASRQPGHHLEAQRGVADAARERTDVIEGKGKGPHAVTGDRVIAALETDDAAARGGDADGASGIGAHSDRREAGCDRRRRAAARATGNAAGSDRVAHGTEMRVRAGDTIGKLVQIGGPHHQRTRRAQARHHLCIMLLLQCFDGAGPAGHRIAGHGHQVFHGNRNAGQRTDVLAGLDAHLELARLAQHRLGPERDERVQRAVRVGTLDKCACHLEGRELAGAHPRRDVRGAREA